MSHRETFKAQLDEQLNLFDIKTGAILELDGGQWACQMIDMKTGEYLGKLRGDAHSSIQACLDQGYELALDMTSPEAVRRDTWIVSNGPPPPPVT